MGFGGNQMQKPLKSADFGLNDGKIFKKAVWSRKIVVLLRQFLEA